jgi:TRAP-type mannitol/chloroaromatic compound transport system permease large subunit
MTALTQGLGLVLAAMVLGWTVLFSLVVSPQAFKTLDTGRAKRMIRDTMKRGHPLVAMVAAGAATAALLAGAIGGAIVMACSAALFMLAAYTLAPRDDPKPKAGVRKTDTARVVAAMLTLMITCIVVAGVVLIGMKI